MALMKLCPRCDAVIDYSRKYCIGCSKDARKDKAANNKAYDKNVRKLRDKQYDSFYHSKEWIKVVEEVKDKYKHLDIYSYYILKTIEYGNISHHIQLLKSDEGWSHRVDIKGLIYLSHSNHALIHSLYDNDYESATKMLYELITRWEKDMCRG